MRTMALSGNLTSAAGILSLLDEPQVEIKVFALQRLNLLVDKFWAEIAEYVSKFEVLYEDVSFPERELSALVASKVYYHLGSFKDSLTFALGAGQKFDVNGSTEYIETILSKGIDRYTQLRVKQFEKESVAVSGKKGGETKVEDEDEEMAEDKEQEETRVEMIDARLESVVNRMFERCLADRRYKQAIGIAFETRRVDILERAIHESGDVPKMLTYCLKVTLSVISSPGFRNTVLKVIVRTYKELEIPDYISVCQCYIFLDDAQSVAQILRTLASNEEEVDNVVVAYQIAFDLYESASQQFLRRVMEPIASILPSPPPSPDINATPTQEKGGAAEKVKGESVEKKEGEVGAKAQDEEKEKKTEGEKSEDTATKTKEEETMEVDVTSVDQTPPTTSDTPTSHDQSHDDKSREQSHDDKSHDQSHDDKSHDKSHDQDRSFASSEEPQPEKEWERRLRFVQTILSGKVTVSMHQEFLIRNNHTDLQILKNTKDSSRGSICHNATIISNGLMHYGTTSDTLLRENLEWLKKASNWAKFTATASLGLVHWGHEKEALNLMASYLPKDSPNSSPYAEGGGLYAIGLIHANHGLKVMDYLANELRNSTSEIVGHGACLGLGLAAMGTGNYDIYDLLKENLMTRDDAVIGEAAGLAMGLVMIGTKSEDALEDMLNYARDTQHEKIQRGLALGISMLMYGQMVEADTLIEDLSRDKDPLLRRSGMFTVAMAYCGSGNNGAIRRLLHVAVSDVDNDVRRAAVTALGFILFRNPEQCPRVVSLLSESFNAHVRCGSAMALGISCAGTGNKEAIAVIDPLLKDPVPFVQQAAQIASSMILIQHTEAMNSKVTTFRQHYAKTSSDKLEDSLTKYGAIIAQGIIDAGGRNVTISLQSRSGHMSMKTAVGLLVFCQFWYWFPFCHFLSLAFTPTAVIGLNSDLKMPKFLFRSNARPSLYAYPQPLEEEKKKEKEKVATAVLSVTAKAKARKTAPGAESMDVEKANDKKESTSDKMDTASTVENKQTDKEKDKHSDVTTKEKPVAGDNVAGEKMEVEGENGEAGGGKKNKTDGEERKETEKDPEPDFEMLSNPARVLPQQLSVLSWDESSQYKPLKPITVGGIIMLKNIDAELPEDLIEPLKVTVPGREEDEGPEPSPPQPFEWSEDM